MLSSPDLADIGITLGDPSGIGPEIVAATLSALPAKKLGRVRVFGDEFVLDRAFQIINEPRPELHCVAGKSLTAGELDPGHPNLATAGAQVEYLEAAIAQARGGRISGLVTAPIHKSWAQKAGFAFPGHTEYLADRLGAGEVAMMFAGPRLKVVLATVHEAIRDLREVLTSARVHSAIVLAARALTEDFGIEAPRIGVLGLNPHAGEEGRFGDEEATIIAPAMERARQTLGDTVSLHGPLVPDAAFRMQFDCFVAMYHDQGLVPVKLLDFEESVNTTLGLPIVRTSPDHGTAYDIAGRGIARATSMMAAVDLAFRLVDCRARRAAPQEGGASE